MSTQTLHLKLTIAGVQVEAAAELPTAPAPRRVLLPILQNLTDTVVTIAEQQANAAGLSVSCRKGCDACCRQMVPISSTEAHALAAVVGGLTPAHQARIQNRFMRAEKKLAALGLLDRLQNCQSLIPAEQHQLDVDYFSAQIPCPFLERKSCSIHPSRPLACREYLVTTPAANCRNPVASQVQSLDIPAKVSTALARQDGESWLPLILTRGYLATHASEKFINTTESLQSILSYL